MADEDPKDRTMLLICSCDRKKDPTILVGLLLCPVCDRQVIEAAADAVQGVLLERPPCRCSDCLKKMT